MEKFSLDTWLKNKSLKVITRDGREVEIFYYNADKTLLVGRISPTEIHQYTKDGYQYEAMNQAKNDLFFADEQSEEIPFGAFDSEFVKDEYYIPEGCEARIEGNKIIIEKKEEELNEFEKELQTIISEASHWTSDDGSISTYCQFGDKEIKKISGQILDLARKELQPEIDKEIDKAYKNIDTIVYDNGYKQGQYEIMKDLPKWKKAEKDEELDCHVAIQQDDRVVLSDFVQKDEYYITLDALKKLPKEE